ncbi:MAG: tRNA N6-adenosine threonylcarbamoyltransferase [Solirubrobacteraceae bacterium]|nr:tRNA N6-adenosine threonylcarbamoyltransferase [Solirubrobacteraceae bacterium]
MILALETSCDDTCAAVVTGDGRVRANVISSQGIHDRYGGVVPEVAARHHLELIDAVVAEALERADAGLDDVSLVAATQGPGLIGALLVGLAAGKALAAGRGLPFAAVDHLRGHVAVAFLEPEPLEPPFVSLIASGGHTLLLRVEDRTGDPEVLARTLDDAAGEAFDKGARMLGLGYPGGAALQALAVGGDPQAFAFPSGRGAEFSFAGLKTALLYKLRELRLANFPGDAGRVAARGHARRADLCEAPDPVDGLRADLAASYQEAIVRAIVTRVERALERTGLDRLAVGGGVAANGPLRERLAGLGARLSLPALELCTDNAAMIASAARYAPALAYPDYLGLEAYATGEGPLR